MNLEHLSDVHTRRHTQWVQHDIQRTSIRKEWHIFYWQNTGNYTLVTMSTSHLISYRNLSLLSNVYTNALVYSRRKFVSILSCEDLRIHNNSVSTMWHS